MPKRQSRLVELGVDWFTSCWALNAWRVTVRPRLVLDRTLIGKTYPSTDNARLLEEKEDFLHLSTRLQPRRVNRSIDTLIG